MIQLLQGDALSVLATLPAGSIQTVITSPPYFNLRRYSDDPREIGQEPIPDCLAWARRRIVGVTPTTDEDGETYYLPTYGKPEPACGACYVCALRAVFAAVWRVLRDDGTCWINLGDSYTNPSGSPRQGETGDRATRTFTAVVLPKNVSGLAAKNLLLIPARVALALQSDGWIVRSDCIWSKPNCMPESVTDRPTRAHEYVYLLSKQARYYYDAAALAEPSAPDSARASKYGRTDPPPGAKNPGSYTREAGDVWGGGTTRNKRSVWTIATRPYAGAHFATMPEALIEPCLLAGSSAQACEHCGAAWGRVVEREAIDYGMGEATTNGHKTVEVNSDAKRRLRTPTGHTLTKTVSTTLGFAPRCACALNTGAASSVVLDPFCGTGTVLRVAERFGRNAIGIELNPDYTELSDARTNGVQKELFV